MKKWENFSQAEIEQFIEHSNSYDELAEKIGYESIQNSSTRRAIFDMIDNLSLDVSHFEDININFDYGCFDYGTKINKVVARREISNLRGRKCEICGLEEWLGQPITLEIHHKDGDKLNNKLNNLQLLCPNCHSTTDNWTGRGKKNQKITVEDVGIYTNIRRSENKTNDGIYKYYATCKICGTVVEKKLTHIKRSNQICRHKPN